MSAFMLFPAEDIKYQISIKGMDRDFTHSGLRPSEFADLTIDIKHKNTTIKSLKITLARGSRAVANSTIERNRFDLGKYKAQARAGDRLVIEIKFGDNSGRSIPSHIIAIPVN